MRGFEDKAHRKMGADGMMGTLSTWRAVKVLSFRPCPCRYCRGMPEVFRSDIDGTSIRIKCGGCNEPVANTFLEVGDAVDAWNLMNGGVRR